jgi:cathepsin L
MALSPQAAVSCVPKTPACLGCKGGWSECAYNFATTTGYFKESDYPYANSEKACAAATTTPAGKIKSAKSVASGSAAAMIQGLKQNSLWVTLHANSNVMFYQSGIIDASSNCTRDINHAVVMVGYGTDEKGTQFYRIRNSWGTTWGEKGHFRLDASGDTCGILRYGGHYPVL